MYSYKTKQTNIFLKSPRVSTGVMLITPLILGVLIIVLSRINPVLTEHYYSNGAFLFIRQIVSATLGSLLSVSLAGLIVVCGPVFCLLLLLYILHRLITCENRKYILLKTVKYITFTVSIIVFFFALLCGPNYNRLTFTEQAGFSLQHTEIEILAAVCEELIVDANTHANEIQAIPTIEEMAHRTTQAYNAMEQYPFIQDAITTPKPMVFSKILSILQITGFYFPYTGEATVNPDMPAIEVPFTMLHELAHTSGFMREDEANFIAYSAGTNSEDVYVRYSATVCAMNHCMNALYSYDYQRFFALRAQYNEMLSQTVDAQISCWMRFDTPIGDVSHSVNNLYLMANNQPDGIYSYGRMVDLIIAEFLHRTAS